MQAGEPADAPKTKLTENLTTTVWDRWEVEAKGLTLKETMSKIEAKYEGLNVRDVLRGGQPVYFHAIMNAPGKEKDKEKTLNTPLADLLDLNSDATDPDSEKYVDLTITCTLKEDKESDDIVEGIPTLRVLLA